MSTIIEQVKTYESACEIAGEDPIARLPFPDSKNDEEEAINAFSKMLLVVRVVNEGWVPDWTNYDQRKYYPWFYMDDEDASAGSRFSFDDFDYVGSDSYVGSRLALKSRELAEYVGKQFTSIYEAFMVIK